MSSNETINGEEEWLMDYELVEEFPAASDYLWPSPHFIGTDPTPSSGIPGLDADDLENKCLCNPPPNKRARFASAAASLGNKACREKMRRERLNDRFRELCFILDPEKPPKAADRVAILRDATCLLTQLRSEAEKLQESNEDLRLAIKTLKAEKLELRDEKTRLRSEKEKMEQMLQGITTTTATPFFSQPAMIMHPAAAAATDITSKAVAQHHGFVPISMWRWVQPAALDTSQDHVLRPPVA